MVLYPFVNRLDGGRYTYRGQSYQFAVNEPARNNSLHGLLMTEHAAALTLLYAYRATIRATRFRPRSD